MGILTGDVQVSAILFLRLIDFHGLAFTLPFDTQITQHITSFIFILR